MEKQKKSGIVSNIIFFVVVILIIGVTYKIFKENNFNEFVKSEYVLKGSKFTRDLNENNSYKIASENFNDAMFYKNIKVNKNTPYKVKCKIKTRNVENEKEKSNAGANICISDTTEKSESITGTNDWTEIELLFDSKNREEINIGFRLGSYDDNSKGEAWFSDFEIYEGTENYDTNWKMGLLIFEDIQIPGSNINNKMSENDIQTLNNNMERYAKSIKALSNNKISITTVTYKITEPLNQISYDEENGYYIDPLDVKDLINEIVEEEKLDHIYIAVKLNNLSSSNTNSNLNDWIGLGGMQYKGIGFSNIRVPTDSSSSYIYKYDININTFPEEVFLHEFLHTLERNSTERGYEIPELHSNEKYGYYKNNKEGLKEWYRAYMNTTIYDSEHKKNIGLPEEIYKYKPVNKTNFEEETKLNLLDEPENMIEEIKIIIKRIKELI